MRSFPHGEQYDDRHLLTQIINAAGDTTTLAYDEVGNRTVMVDAVGSTTTTVYDALDRVIANIDAAGFRSTVVYDEVGNVINTIDALNRTTTSIYDELNRRVSFINALNQQETLVYDEVGNTIAHTDALLRTTTFGYDELNRQITTTDALNNISSTVYDAVGNVIATIDALNRATTFNYDQLDRLVSITNALNQTTSFGYDEVGNQISMTDALNRTTTTVYDELNREIASIDPLNQISSQIYDAVGNVIAFTNARNQTTSFGYDELNRRITTTDALNNTSSTVYDAVGNVINTIDALNRTTTYLYDDRHLLTQVIDAAGGVTSLAYDEVGNRIAAIDAEGATTTTVYDALDRVIANIDAAGFRSTIVYDEVGNVVNTIDALSQTNTFGYDELNRLIASTDASGATTSFGYDEVGNRITTTNARGFTTTVLYDDLNRQEVIIDALSGHTTVGYDAVGNTLFITDANNNTTTFGYDELNRRITTTNVLNLTTTTIYDEVGNVVGVVDPLSYRTTITYNERDEQIAIEAADNGITSFGYDAVGNRITTIDPNGNTTTQVYDELNRVINVVDALGLTTTYEYDNVGRLTLQTDASNNTTTFGYDVRGLLIQETDALGNAFTFSYDDIGQRTSMTDRLGRRRDYEYDDVGRLETEKWYATGGSFVQTQTMVYDDVGNLLSVSDPNGSISFTYDELNRKTIEQGLFGQILTSTYDAVGNRLTREDNRAGLETFSYDAINRLTSQQSTRGGVEPVRIDYDYTDRDQLETIRRYVDLSATTLIAQTDVTYDPVGRETHRITVDGLSATLSEITLTYDLGGRLTSQEIDTTLTTYGYDLTDQLTAAGSLAYDYDATGNRDSAGYTTTASNRTDAAPNATYAYDTEGNRIGKTDTGTGDYWSYEFDTRNQLTHVEHRDSGNNLLLEVDYKYDAFGRRIEEIRNGTAVTRFAYDGHDVLADLNGGNTLQTRYIRNGEIDNLGARVSAGGAVDFYLTDRQNTVVAIADDTGTVINRLEYDAFGNLVSESSPANGDRYTFQGRELDRTLQLAHHRWRYYDPMIAKWLSEDPIRWSAGDINLSRFVGNGPTNGTDPMGQYLVVPESAKAAWEQKFKELKIPVNFIEFTPTTAPAVPSYFVQVPSAYRERVALLSRHADDDYLQTIYDALLDNGQEIIGDANLVIAGHALKPEDRQFIRDRSLQLYVGSWRQLSSHSWLRRSQSIPGLAILELASELNAQRSYYQQHASIAQMLHRLDQLAGDSEYALKENRNLSIYQLPSEYESSVHEAFMQQRIGIRAGLELAYADEVGRGTEYRKQFLEKVKSQTDDAIKRELYSAFLATETAEGRAAVKRAAAELLVLGETYIPTRYEILQLRDQADAYESMITPQLRQYSGPDLSSEAQARDESEKRFRRQMAAIYAAAEPLLNRVFPAVQLAGGVAELAIASELMKLPGGQYHAAMIGARGASDVVAGIWGLATGQFEKPRDRVLVENVVGSFGLSHNAAEWVGFTYELGAPLLAARKLQQLRQGQAAAKVPTQATPLLDDATLKAINERDFSHLKNPGSLEVISSNLAKTPEELAKRLNISVDEALRIFGACFAAGTLLRTPDGAKPIELFRAGDLILSRDENNPNGMIVAKVVEEVFVRTGRVWLIRIGGQEIRTTGEHPFYAQGKGWTALAELTPADRLLGESGEWLAIEKLEDTGSFETVYNLRVADYHTYFVGCQEWGFSVWAHNLCYQDWLTKHGLTHSDELEAIFKSAVNRTLTPETEKLVWDLIAKQRRSTVVRTRAWKDLQAVELENLPKGRALTADDLPLLRRYLNEEGGRWGSKEVRELNHRLASQYEDAGWTVTGGAGRRAEEHIPARLTGTKEAYVDITLTKDGKTIRIQTATMEGNKLEASEIVKAQKIMAAFPSDELIIISKDTGKVVPYP